MDILIQVTFEELVRRKLEEQKILKAANRKAVTWDTVLAVNSE